MQETTALTPMGDFDAALPVREVIKRLLVTALPAELRAAAVDLTDRVAEHPDVAPHVDKLWGELSEAEGNVVAREVGLD